MVCADCRRPLNCCDESELEADLTLVLSMLVHTARPMLPPKIRACVNAPTKTAEAGVQYQWISIKIGSTSGHTSVLLLDSRRGRNDQQA